jgi:uncharacterized protein with PIN domain
MAQGTIRFYAELNDYLSSAKRHKELRWQASCPRSIREVLRAFAVPPTEVDLVIVEGRSVDLSYRPREGERISVFPVFESMDVSPIQRIRRRPLRRTRFVLDSHLGRLAKYLRLLGFDSLYRNDYDDPQLVAIAAAERRILLSRDRGLLERRAVTHGHRVRATAPRHQLLEVLHRFDLGGSATPFTRCLSCNGRLRPVPKEAVLERLPPLTRRHYDEFALCPSCDRVLWKGSHYRRMRQFVAAVLRAASPTASPEASRT